MPLCIDSFSRLLIILAKPISRRLALSRLVTVQIRLLVCRSLWLLFDLGIDLLVLYVDALVDGWLDALAIGTGWDPTDLGSIHLAYIVVHSPDAVVVRVCYVHLYISSVFVIQGGDSTWLIEASLESGFILQASHALAQP